MNPGLDKLQPYPFAKLAGLKAGIQAPANLPEINLSIGEPKQSPPAFIAEEIITHLHGLAQYPATRGSLTLRETIMRWLTRRFSLQQGLIDPDLQILPVNGTREALFSIAQCLVDRNTESLVMMPNPFYQIYEGAALLAGAEPFYLNTTAETAWLPDLDAVPASAWERCQLLYICTPGNPTGAVMGIDYLVKLIELADHYDFVIASDECYSEIYPSENTPPPGLLEAAVKAGNTDFRHCIVFHSLSKRSNVPGMRSGFVAGDTHLIEKFFRYRTYHGCAMSPYTQAASIAAWNDETHVRNNRELYQNKFSAVCNILEPVMKVRQPEGGFYLWPDLGADDVHSASELYAAKNITVLPGSFLSRENQGINPGCHHVRIALVASMEECTQAANHICDFINQSSSMENT